MYGAYGAARRMIFWSVPVGTFFAAALMLSESPILGLFTDDAAVIGEASGI